MWSMWGLAVNWKAIYMVENQKVFQETHENHKLAIWMWTIALS